MNITTEGKELTLRMLERDPKLRISAKEALDHSWFTLEQTGNKLSIAQENMKKYCNGERFNVEKIKPVFGFAPVVPAVDPCSSGSLPEWDSCEVLEKCKPGSKMNSPKETEFVLRNTEHDTANFEEDEISENSNEVSDRVSSPMNKSAVPRVSLHKPYSRRDLAKFWVDIDETHTPISNSNNFNKHSQESFDLEHNKSQKKELRDSPKEYSIKTFDCFFNAVNNTSSNSKKKPFTPYMNKEIKLDVSPRIFKVLEKLRKATL
jgi:serine/threonine protein kinase